MKVAIFVGDNHEVGRATQQGLTSVDLSTQYDLIVYSDLMIVIRGGIVDIVDISSHESICQYDLSYIRGITDEQMRNSIGQVLKHRNKKFINSELAQTQFTSKAWQYVAFAQNGVSIPDSLVLRADKISHDLIQEYFEYPCVVKGCRARNGEDNFLVERDFDLAKLDSQGMYVIQPYIENNFDYRIIVADDDVLIAYKRRRQDSLAHTNNISQGGIRERVDSIPAEVQAMAIKAASVVSRDLSGVDVIVSTSGVPYVLEANFNFGTPRVDDAELDRYFVKLAQYLKKKSKTSL